MRGNDSRTVIASEIDADYDPDSVQHYSAEDIERLFEFVERKDNIDTYRNKETGKLVYHTRKTETSDELFASAFDTVWQLRREAGTPPRSGDDASKVQETIECLQSLAANHPGDARVALALGMAWFAIGKDDQSQRQLTRAVELESDNTIMLKELGSVSLTRGDFPVALDAATKAVTIKPELLGNLAVIQLLSGNVAEAKAAIEHAVHLQPEDEVNRNVQSVIAAVAAGKRECPTSLEEMMQPAKPKTWLARLIGG